ncbi:hypothetical protein GP486_005743, partial [Trichoglossum hirsutum]
MAGNPIHTTYLNAHNQPRMPFSSPIGEEVPSPVSPLDALGDPQPFSRKILDPFSTPPLPADEPVIGGVDSRGTHGSTTPFDGGSLGSSPQTAKSTSWAIEAARTATRNSSPRQTRNYAVHKTSRDRSRRSKRQDLRPGKPGIRVVTNFSKPHDLVQAAQQSTDPHAHLSRQPESTGQVSVFAYRTPIGTPVMLTEAQSMARQDSIRGRDQQEGAFISLSDLKAIDGTTTTTAPTSFWKSMLGDGHKREKKTKDKVEDTMRTEKRKQPLLSRSSPQRVRERGFKSKTFRQNTRNYEDINEEEDEEPILAAGDADAEMGFRRSISPDQSDDRTIADLGTMDRRGKNLAPSPTRTVDGLSPSDRPIVIGLSIPPGELAGLQFSPQSASSDSVNPTRTNNVHRRDLSEATTVTPTILVTPASEGLGIGYMPFRTEQTGKEQTGKEQTSKGRPRARSSVYSQPGMSPLNMADAVPPMPTVPAKAYNIQTSENPFKAKANVVRDSTITVFEEDEDPKTNVRGVSTYTVFEDESPTEPDGGRYRSGSGSAKATKELSIDTAGAHRRSLGWWNYLLTPFLTRSNTSATDKHNRSPSDKWERPVIPSLAQAATMVSLQEERDEKSWEKEFSPDTDKPVGPKSGHTTMWSDMSTWEDERGAIGIAIDHTPRTSTVKPKSYHHSHKSSETIPVMMTGSSVGASATDYPPRETYEHNQNNPFRQVGEYKVGTKGHPQGSNPFYSPVSPPDGHEARQPIGRETNRDDRAIIDPFNNVHQHTAQNGQSHPLHDSPSGVNITSRQESAAIRLRSDSEVTEFEEDDYPSTARDAKGLTARGPAPGAVIGAGGPKPREVVSEMQNSGRHAGVESAQPPPYSPPRDNKFQPQLAIRPQAQPSTAYRQPDSPGPLSPGMTQLLSSRGAIPMSDVPHNPAPVNVQRTETIATGQSDLYMRPRAVPVTLADLERPSDARQDAEARRKRIEKEDALGRKLGGLWRGRACFSSKGCFGRSDAGGRKRRRCILCSVVGFILIFILVIVLATTVARRKHPAKATTPAKGPQWLNLTNFPPIPLGVNTINQPEVFSTVTACVFPSTMWSCSLPKELQQPNGSGQPSFNLRILYRNDSISNSSGASSNNNSSKRAARDLAGNAVSAGSIIRERILAMRDSAAPDVFWQPVPSPPSLEDQRFLGNTTDNVRSSNKEGEETPLYISFLSTTSPSGKLSKRQQQDSPSSSNSSFPDLTANIPPPSSAVDGTAAPANLLPSPLPLQQPVRLYDRGLPTEHYGFYSYFDRSIFLKSTALLNQSDVPLGEVPADENGGSTESEARVRCTWAQTRFLVQIWTNMSNRQLVTSKGGGLSAPSSAGNPPGSFPYPVTITIDRHGGDASRKMVYCY